MSGSYPARGDLSAEELRDAVRAVLRDVLPELVQGAASAGAEPLVHVTVRSDSELDTLVRRVASLCEDPTRRAALRDGRHGFRLAGGPPGADGSGRAGVAAARGPSPASPGIVRVERGAVTERTVARAAADGARLVVGAKAVLTPLARDKARVLGVLIEKEG